MKNMFKDCTQPLNSELSMQVRITLKFVTHEDGGDTSEGSVDM